jgi:DNA recombination protein RmuC
MTAFIGIFLFIIGFLFGALFIWFIRQKEIDISQSNRDQLKSEFGNLSKEALDQNLETFLKLAENKFSELVKSSDGQLDQKKQLIDQSLVEMKKKLEGLDKSTNELKGQVVSSQKGIGDLAETTTQLSRILSSSQARGQWGERMVEDILNFMGLVEGINFEKQAQAGEGRPDFTFRLPDNKCINMDVKFPLTHYENYLSTDVESEQEKEKKEFIKDVRMHVKAIEKRSYIDPEGGTLDYVLMFIPNESIYVFLNQEDRELIDFSLSKKVLLCSPITLYAVLSLIRQSVSNFSMEQKAGEMQELVGIFRKQWDEFIVQMEKLGNTLGTVQSHFEKLVSTRRNQLEKPMDRIKELQLGQDESKKELNLNTHLFFYSTLFLVWALLNLIMV